MVSTRLVASWSDTSDSPRSVREFCSHSPDSPFSYCNLLHQLRSWYVLNFGSIFVLMLRLFGFSISERAPFVLVKVVRTTHYLREFPKVFEIDYFALDLVIFSSTGLTWAINRYHLATFPSWWQREHPPQPWPKCHILHPFLKALSLGDYLSALIEAGFESDVGSSRYMNIMEWQESRCGHQSSLTISLIKHQGFLFAISMSVWWSTQQTPRSHQYLSSSMTVIR